MRAVTALILAAFSPSEKLLATMRAEMLDARIEAVEFRQVIERLIAIAAHQPFQQLFHMHDIHQVAVLIQIRAFQLELQPVVMGMLVVFRPPIAADEEMLGDKVPLYCQPVHRIGPFYGSE